VKRFLEEKNIIIIIITIIVSFSITWGVTLYKVEVNKKAIGEYDNVENRVSIIETENKARDKQFEKLEILIKELTISINKNREKMGAEFHLLDTRLKLIEYSVNNSILYGSLDELEKLKKDIEDARKQKKIID